MRADALIQTEVEGELAATPPLQRLAKRGSASDTQRPFAGQARAIVARTDAGFIAPREGFRVYDKSATAMRNFTTLRQRTVAPLPPQSGATVDTEARATLVSLLARLTDAGIFAAN